MNVPRREPVLRCIWQIIFFQIIYILNAKISRNELVYFYLIANRRELELVNNDTRLIAQDTLSDTQPIMIEIKSHCLTPVAKQVLLFNN